MNILEKFILLLIATNNCIFKPVQCDCQIDLSGLTTSSAKEPLFLSGTSNDNLDFKIPINGFLQFTESEYLHLYCPNKGLFSTTCKGVDFDPKPSLVCQLAQSPSARLLPNTVCGPNNGNEQLGRLYQIGYQVPNLRFLPLTTICRNDNTDSTYYVKHNLDAGGIERSMKNERFKSWNMFGLNARLTQPFINKNYFEINQDRYFERIGFRPNDYLVKGHLNPCADHPFQAWNKATFFYLNHIPQWSLLNKGVWLKVENYVRKLSQIHNIVIYTGGHGQYSVNGHYLYIVENNQRVEVPKFIWKLIIIPKINFSIAFVIMNTTTDLNRDSNMCIDRDQECINLGFQNYINDASSGFLSCCSIENLRNMIGDQTLAS